MDAAQLKFEALVNAYSADLYRYAYWMTRQTSLAEDLVQETFMRAWRALDRLEDPQAAKAWLWTILRREVARHFERRKREADVMDDYAQSSVTNNAAANPAELWALRRALNELPPDYREALLLQVIGGYSCDEIARMVGKRSGAIMTRLSRARRKLRAILTDEDELQEKVRK